MAELSVLDRRDLAARLESLERELKELRALAAQDLRLDELISLMPITRGVVVDEARARASACVEYDLGGGATLTFAKEGVAGALDAAQRALFCPAGVERREVPPAQRERYRALIGARDACKAQLAGRPADDDPVTPWIRCLYQETSKRGYEL